MVFYGQKIDRSFFESLPASFHMGAVSDDAVALAVERARDEYVKLYGDFCNVYSSEEEEDEDYALMLPLLERFIQLAGAVYAEDFDKWLAQPGNTVFYGGQPTGNGNVRPEGEGTKEFEELDGMVSAMEGIRGKLVSSIRKLVEKHGIIGTYYKNVGFSFYEGKEPTEFDDSPVLVFDSHHSYCNTYMSVICYEIFIEKEKGELSCVVKDEYEGCEYYDIPVGSLLTESLICLYGWLMENGFGA